MFLLIPFSGSLWSHQKREKMGAVLGRSVDRQSVMLRNCTNEFVIVRCTRDSQ